MYASARQRQVEALEGQLQVADLGVPESLDAVVADFDVVRDGFRNDVAELLREWGYDVITEAENPRALTFNVPGFAGPRRFDIGV